MMDDYSYRPEERERYRNNCGDVFAENLCLHKNSSESLASNTIPWKRIYSRNRPVVTRNESGREVTPSSFYLCLIACLILFSGVFMTGTSIWALLCRASYSCITANKVKIDFNCFTLCGGLLSIPCSWVAWTSHDNRKNYMLLPVLIILLGLSLSMYSTGAGLAITSRTKMHFTGSTESPKLVNNSYYVQLNASLFDSMTEYDTSYNYQLAWDKVQAKFNCCGVEEFADWKVTRLAPPRSCYNGQHIYRRGCIDPVAADLAWQLCISIGFTLMVLSIQGLSLLIVLYYYFNWRVTTPPITFQV